MSLFKLRAWAVLAALIAVQAPSIAAAKARVDRQVEDLAKQGGQSNQKLRLIIQPGANSAGVLKALKAHGVKVLRQHHIGRLSIEVSRDSLSWLQNLQG